MKVHIEGKIYLESDTMQFILKEYTGAISIDKKTGKETEVCNNIGYFTTIQSALLRLLKMKLADSTATNLVEMIADIKRIEEGIKAKFEITIKEGEAIPI
jgi:hypothetical protein